MATMLGIILIATFLSVSGFSIDSKNMCYLLNCKTPLVCTVKDLKCEEGRCPRMVYCAKDLVERTLGISDCAMVRCSDGFTCVTSLQHCILGMCNLATCVPVEEAETAEMRHQIFHRHRPDAKEPNILMQGKPSFELDYFTTVPLNRRSWRRSGMNGLQPHIVEYSVDYFGDRFIVPLDALENKTVDLRRIRSSLDYLNLLKQLSQAHAKVLQKNKKEHGSQQELTPGCKANNCNVRYNLLAPQRTDFHDKIILENKLVGSHSVPLKTMLNNITGTVNNSKSFSKERGEKKSKDCCVYCCPDCKNTTQTPSLTESSCDRVNNSHCCHSQKSQTKCHPAVNLNQVTGEQSNIKMGDALIPTRHNNSEEENTVHEGSESVESTTQGIYCHEKGLECCSTTDLTTASTDGAQLLKMTQEVPASLSGDRGITEASKVLEGVPEMKMESVKQAVKNEKLNAHEAGQLFQNGSLSDQEISTEPHKDVLMKGLGKKYHKTGIQSKKTPDSIILRDENRTGLCNASPNSTCDLNNKEATASGTHLEENVNDFNSSTLGPFLDKTIEQGNLSLADNSSSYLKTNKSLPEFSTASLLDSQYSHDAFLRKDNLTSGEDDREGNDSELTRHEFKMSKCPDCSNETHDNTKSARKRESPRSLQGNLDGISEYALYPQFNKFPEIFTMIKKQLKKSSSTPSKLVLPRKFQHLDRVGGSGSQRNYKFTYD